MSGTGDGVIPTGPSGNENPNASDNSDDTTLIIGVAAAIGALFLLVLILFVLFVLYYYKKGDPNLNADEEIYHSSRATSRAGSRAGSRRGSRAGSLAGSLSRRGSIIRSTSLRNSFHSDRVFLPNNGWNKPLTPTAKSTKKSHKSRRHSGSLDLPRVKDRSSLMTHQFVRGSLDNLRSVSSASNGHRPGFPEHFPYGSFDKLHRSSLNERQLRAAYTQMSRSNFSMTKSTSLPGSLNQPRREKKRPSVLTYTHHSVRSLDQLRRKELRKKLMEDPKLRTLLKRSGSVRMARSPRPQRRVQSKSTDMTSKADVTGSLDRIHGIHMNRMATKSDPMSELILTGSFIDQPLPDPPRGSTNKGFSDTYEDLDRELWKQSKPDQGTVTHNPLAAFGKDDDFNPIDVNLEGFDKDYKGGIAAEEDVDSGMAETVDETNNDNSKDSNNESGQIQILDMTTWSSPPSSPIRMSQPTPFTVSAQVASSQGDLNSDRGDEYTVDFARANPLNNSASVSDLNRSSMKNRNQSVVDFYENANPRILGYSMDFPSDAYGTGRRLLWQKKHFDNK
ncbi:uncharacterized protein [Amphiura filiformis]|uniref:uncharacterized protein isoform X2 n=1 Tax=Amphiura filiformis TaxID=82378 RepID=UPI003B222822